MTIDDETPLERLQAARLACELGIASAEACLQEEWLKPYEAAYRNRQAWWLTTRDAVDRAIAELPKNAVAADLALIALWRARRAGQVTVREFRQRAAWLGEHHG